MPRTKRPLAELDANASRPRASKRSKGKDGVSADQGESKGKQNLNTRRSEGDVPQEEEPEERVESFEYENKDNSKLRAFLLDRGLSTSGTREELIERLENSSIDYESFSSEEIVEMLKRRHVTNGAAGPKALKMERLRTNDKIDRDTGTPKESSMYGRFDAFQMMLSDREKIVADDGYTSKTPRVIASMLKKRELSCAGTISAQISRLRKDDQKRLKEMKKKRDLAKSELEEVIGHPVNLSFTTRTTCPHAVEDRRLEQEARNAQPRKQICDYNWKDSHWASRTERELSEICRRREMPGYGPKAAMLKWLDTGSVDYEDFYVGSLERLCSERGLPVRSGSKKVELIRRLKESDEAETSAHETHETSE